MFRIMLKVQYQMRVRPILLELNIYNTGNLDKWSKVYCVLNQDQKVDSYYQIEANKYRLKLINTKDLIIKISQRSHYETNPS